MKIFVINLEKDPARRAFMEKQLRELGLEYEIFRGVLGSALTKEELAECFDERHSIRNFGFRLIPAHIGCSLSHVRLYAEIIRRELPCALILEDDAILPPNLKEVVDAIESSLDKRIPQTVLLSPSEREGAGKRTPLGTTGYALVPYGKAFYTSSYIVNQSAARALYRELYPIHDVADCWTRLKRYRVVEIRTIFPALIRQEQGAFTSSTNADMNAAIARGQCFGLRYKLRRASCKVFDVFYGFFRRHFRPYAGIDF